MPGKTHVNTLKGTQPMATATSSNPQTPSATLNAFAEKIKSQVNDAKAKLDQVEAKAKETKAHAETATVNDLKTMKQNIDRKVQDLKTTHDAHVARIGRLVDTKKEIDDLAEMTASRAALHLLSPCLLRHFAVNAVCLAPIAVC